MILVFGSINFDIALHTARLPAAGETVIGATPSLSPGGKGANQAAGAARAGAEVRLVARVGNDALADAALAGPQAAGVDLSGVKASPAATGCASIWVGADGENRILVASGANAEARADDVADANLGPGTLVVLQMEVPTAENWRLARRAKAAGARVLLNLAPAAAIPPTALDDIDILVVNEGEGAVLTGHAAGDGATRVAALRVLAARHGLEVVLTLGAEGARHIAAGGVTAVPALPVSVLDTTAAGDTFVGVLAAGLDAGLEIAPALRGASVAAALCCTRAGAQTSQPDAGEIAAHLDALPGSGY